MRKRVSRAFRVPISLLLLAAAAAGGVPLGYWAAVSSTAARLTGLDPQDAPAAKRPVPIVVARINTGAD
jgi:hypothetical protein